MKMLSFSRGRRAPSVSTAIVAGLVLIANGFLGVRDGVGQDRVPLDPPLWLGHHVALRVADITEAGAPGHRVVVTFAGLPEVARRSLGDGDIWVASPGGYNEPGTLVSVREVPALEPVDPVVEGFDPNDPGIDPLLWPRGPVFEVTYRIPAPRREGWSADDNGYHAVLLAPREVFDVEGGALAPRLLGDFDVRIRPGGGGGGEPVFPAEVGIGMRQFPVPGLPGGPVLTAVIADIKLAYRESGVRVEWGEVRRDGTTFTATMRAVAPAEDGPPRPENDDAPDDAAAGDDGSHFRHSFDLGVLEGGAYRFVLMSNGRMIGGEPFVVEGGGGGGEPEPVIPDDVHIRVTPLPAILIFPPPPTQWGARVELVFDDPRGVEVVDWGEVRREGEAAFVVDVAAVRHSLRERDADDGLLPPPPPPDDARFGHEYLLGTLKPGIYGFVVTSRGEPVGRVSFTVPGDPGGGEVPDAEVGLRVDTSGPGVVVHTQIRFAEGIWEVVDPGRAVREGDRFVIDATVRRLPIVFFDGNAAEAEDGGDAIDRIRPPDPQTISLTHRLGELERGEYGVHFRMNGESFARAAFRVPGDPGEENPPPTVAVEVEDVVAAGDAPHPFTLRVHDRSGLDLEALRGARVWAVTPFGERLAAEQVSFANTEDLPPSGAHIEYRLDPPGGSWDARDNGRYLVVIDREAVRDLQGNTLADGVVGRFAVEIWPDPDPDPRPRPVEIDVAADADGRWTATVALGLPEEFASRDDWEVRWGSLRHRGSAIVASIRFVRAGADIEEGEFPGPLPPLEGLLDPDERPGGEPVFIRHAYELGALRPGDHVFIAMSNLGHFGRERFRVPRTGGEDGGAGAGDTPFDRWAARVFTTSGDPAVDLALAAESADGDGGRLSTLMEYAFGTDPEDGTDDAAAMARPVVVNGDDGGRHLGLRFRRILAGSDLHFRFEASADLVDWEDVTDQCDLVERAPSPDGIEEVVACLREPLDASPHRYLRLVVERSPATTAGE